MMKSLLITFCLLFFAAVPSCLIAGEKPHLVFLVSRDTLNYEAHRTIPQFAEELDKQYRVTVIESDGTLQSSSFPGIEVLEDADLLVVFCRRLALPAKEMKLIQEYADSGKPVMGIRTANHAFTVLSGQVPNGYLDWPEFVADVLGCENRGYGPTEPGTDVKLVAGSNDHEIMRGVDPLEWHSEGNVYLVDPLLDQEAVVLLEGHSEDLVQPIAWTRVNAKKGKVFYTSLGYPTDFNKPQFKKMLKNAITWLIK